MKILLAGGGSGGPVSPVLAVAEEIKKQHHNAEFLFVGTSHGPERKMVDELHIKFRSISSAKLRRYWSLKNLFTPFVFVWALGQSLKIVRQFKPEVFFSAGGFVAVPLAYACKMSGVRIVIHQQDAQIGLANKLIAAFASEITTAFQITAKEFFGGSGLSNKKWKQVLWTGNPVRPEIFGPYVDAKKYFNLHEELPILLVLGGGTGSKQINDLIERLLPDLVLAHQVVHQTGVGKNTIEFKHRNYHVYEFLPFAEYASILNMAHLVICRAGMSTIAELSALGKTAIVIPMPGTHQEENAKILQDTHSAAVLFGNEVENLDRVINSLKFNQKRDEMQERNISKLMPKDAATKIAQIVVKVHER